jgi:hypothetical protein
MLRIESQPIDMPFRVTDSGDLTRFNLGYGAFKYYPNPEQLKVRIGQRLRQLKSRC